MNNDDIDKSGEDMPPYLIKSEGIRTACMTYIPEALIELDLFVGEEPVFNGEFNIDESHKFMEIVDDFLYYRNEWRLH
jgi:hypothetical protein